MKKLIITQQTPAKGGLGYLAANSRDTGRDAIKKSVPGYHFNLFEVPQVNELGKLLKQCLEKAQERGNAHSRVVAKEGMKNRFSL